MREVSFYKSGLSTIIEIFNNGVDLTKRIVCNKNLDIHNVGENLIIENSQDSNFPLIVNFNEIRNKLSTTNVENYLLAAANINLFVVTQAGGGSGGSNTSYNSPFIYQNDNLELPHIFEANSLHSISITCVSGELEIIVNQETAILTEGATVNYTASSELNSDIEIVATTGTFTITTLQV